MSDHDLVLLGLSVAIVGAVVAVVPVAIAAWRWQHRRRPLRIEIGPNARRDDAVWITVTTVGDEDLALAWGSAKADDGGDYTLQRTVPEMHGLAVTPNSDGATFLLERDEMPVAGVTWLALTIFDMTGHRLAVKIPPRYAAALRRT